MPSHSTPIAPIIPRGERDTACARSKIFRIKFVSRPPDSAVAAAALPAQSKIIHPKGFF